MTPTSPYFNLFDYLLGDDRLDAIGSATAIEFRGRVLTYGDLGVETDRWIERLAERGVRQGDRVALLLFDSPEFIACLLAAAKLGAIAVPVNTFLPADDVAFIVSDSGARIVILESELQIKLKTVESRPLVTRLVIDTASRNVLAIDVEGRVAIADGTTTRESPAFLLYTSGSTGAPKGVLHLHGSIPHTVENYSENVLRLTKLDRVYSSSRLFFAYGLGNSLSFPLAAGATVVLDDARASPEQVAAIFEHQRPTVFFGVPSVYLTMLEFRAKGGKLDTSSLRLCVSAGEALPSQILEQWERECGLTILDGIGSTEMLHIFISNREGNSRPGSSGTIVPGYAARLDGEQAASGEQLGNLWVRGFSATPGYWNRPDLTRETIQDGWVRTGDIYRRDADGFYYHVGRSDDCFKVRGLWVSPIEVESALLGHEAVLEAAVVSGIGNDGLATTKAYVVIRGKREGLTEELIAYARSRLAANKTPSQVEFIDEMPRTSTGKIQRFKLRETAKGSGEQDD